jgi:zinc transport system substrate-binding protein
MRLPAFSCVAASAFLLSSLPSIAAVNVMASIKPVQSLVAAVTAGVGTPGVIVDGANSPHTYTLKPSDAEALSQAQVIFWIGEDLEAFLKKPLAALGDKAIKVNLMEAKGIQELSTREGNGFDAHDDHDHEGEASSEAGHADHEHDPHIWLDPENAKVIVTTVAETLSKADPENASTYAANAEATRTKLDALSAEIKATLQGNKNSFIVFHDAYQYFEKRFGLQAAGAVAVHPENPPGAKGINDIRNRITDAKVSCVYTEPQFDPKLVNVIIEGTNVKTGILDPLGANLEPGPDLYFTMLRNLANGIKGC